MFAVYFSKQQKRTVDALLNRTHAQCIYITTQAQFLIDMLYAENHIT